MKTFLFSLVSLLFCTTITAQQITISGTVSDIGGNKLAGVQVTIKASQRSTSTDKGGKYSILASKGETLVFSMNGYFNQEVVVSSATYDAVLIPSPPSIDVVPQQKHDVPQTDIKAMVRTVNTNALLCIDQIQECEKSVSMAVCDVSPQYPGRTSAAQTQSYYDGMRDESYSAIRENGFIDANKEPLSTLSVNVDAASYSNMRRYLNRGELPPADAIRTEELINYFTYNLPKPTGSDPVRITTEVGQCPWNMQNRLVRIGLKAREVAGEDLPASNLVFLIDVSGSMQGPTRLELVKSSLKLLVNNLRDKDRVAIVVYAGAAGEVLPSTSGSDKQRIREALDGLSAGGSTAGGAGIQLAYEVASRNFITGGNNRVILCTDGDFNVGVSSKDGLEGLIAAKRQSGVFLSILGYGMGNYKDDRLQILSSKGNGNYAYIDNLQEANRVLVSEFGGTICTVAKDVKLQVEFNPAKVQAYRLIGYETRLLNKQDFNDDTKDAGEMGAGHTVTALYEVVPVGVTSPVPPVDQLRYQQTDSTPGDKQVWTKAGSPASAEMLYVKLRYKDPDGSQSRKIEVPVVDRGGNGVSGDFRFAAAVAMFGQLMRDSQYKGSATFGGVIALANQGLAYDPQGYRAEFIRMAGIAQGLKGDAVRIIPHCGNE